jgi:hypothetical protein
METDRRPGWGVRFMLTRNGVTVRLENLEGARYDDLERAARPLSLSVSRQSPTGDEGVIFGDVTGLTTKTPDEMVQKALEFLGDLLHKPVLAGCVSRPASFAKKITEEWVVNGGMEIPW